MISRSVLDSQKLKYHTELLQRWQQGETIWPIYFEIGPAGACNNRCIFCAYDYLDNNATRLSVDVVRDMVQTLGRHGAKACMFAGEGEPTLHDDLSEMVACARENGIEVAITSNFLRLDRQLSSELLGHLTWIRCSLNATDEATYRAIHRGPDGGFETVLHNISEAVDIRNREGLATTIGVQCIALEDTLDGMVDLARRVRQIGVDYLSIKPCIQHPQMSYQVRPPDPACMDAVTEELAELATDSFSVVVRRAGMNRPRRYDHCLALPFFVEVISDGRVYACGPRLGDERFCYGNLYEQSFEQLWLSQRREQVCRWAAEQLDVHQCMGSCRLDQINEFLWTLKRPPAHVNFI